MPLLSTFGALSAKGFGLTSANSYKIDYLVVAGGGGGAYTGGNPSGAGGGGAGGYRQFTNITIPIGKIYTANVGAGAARPVSTTGFGFNGTDSSLIGTQINITSSGGGGGGGIAGSNGGGFANTGGSGGGRGGQLASNGLAGADGNTPSTSPSQGNNGGPNSWAEIRNEYGDLTGYSFQAGGGGGASAAGTNGSGGAGSTWLDGVTRGGGGGGNGVGTGPGGSGGGGRGLPSTGGEAGTVNTGGGGGGGQGNYNQAFYGGAGGSGIVIIRYVGTTQRGTGGTVTTANGYTYHTFTSSGTYTS